MTRGRPKSATPRVSVSLRVEADVLNWWRSTGNGWQTRMSGLLRSVAFSEGIEARLAGQAAAPQDVVPTVDHVTHIGLTDKPTSVSVADVTRAVEKIDEDHPLISLLGGKQAVRIAKEPTDSADPRLSMNEYARVRAEERKARSNVVPEPSPIFLATPESVQKRIAALGDDHSNNERAHETEDEIWFDVLMSIALGACADPSACARLAIQTQHFDFERYYS